MNLSVVTGVLLLAAVAFASFDQNLIHDPNLNHEAAKYFRRDAELPVGGPVEEAKDRSKRLTVFPSYGGICEVCCGGKRYNGQFDYSTQCCKDTYYSASTARCCDGVVKKLTNSNDYLMQCCGKELYNITTQICCGTMIKDKSHSQEFCCGDKEYDANKQICCDSVLFDVQANGCNLCCGNKVYDSKKQRCGPNNELANVPEGIKISQFCGGKVIDYEKQICCSGVPGERKGKMSLCCGNTVYDASTEVCCGGTAIKDDGTGFPCCGKERIDPLKMVCCKGKSYSKPNEPYSYNSGCIYPVTYNIYNDYTSYGGCCGDELWDQTKQNQICCNQTLHTFDNSTERYRVGCCGDATIDYAKQTCCNGKVSDGVGFNCCGDVAYDPSSKTCCAGELFDIGKVPLDKCCCEKGSCYPSYINPIPYPYPYPVAKK